MANELMADFTGSVGDRKGRKKRGTGNGFHTGFPERYMATGESRREIERGYLAGICSTSVTGSYAQKAKRALAVAISAGLVFAAEPSTHSRTVVVRKDDIVPVYALHNYSTMVEIPKGEEIMAVSCGDKDSWAINYSGNIAFIKPDPKRNGLTTNLNLVAASGNTYSLLIKEVTTDKQQQADLRVLLDQGEESGLAAIQHPTFVRSDALDELKASLQKQSEELAQTKKTAAVSEVKDIVHDYEWKKGKESEAFGLRAIYHDSVFTYIEAKSQNAPALYQVLDGKESVVQYELRDGKYVVPVVLGKGFLRAGKTKLEFERKG